ncbi:hypothetical protein C8R43DRAFT_974849 [Mycena crocata]|nr:hypothetical protein C8R43DRAFT_974849 [Mycena crocata]
MVSSPSVCVYWSFLLCLPQQSTPLSIAGSHISVLCSFCCRNWSRDGIFTPALSPVLLKLGATFTTFGPMIEAFLLTGVTHSLRGGAVEITVPWSSGSKSAVSLKRSSMPPRKLTRVCYPSFSRLPQSRLAVLQMCTGTTIVQATPAKLLSHVRSLSTNSNGALSQPAMRQIRPRQFPCQRRISPLHYDTSSHLSGRPHNFIWIHSIRPFELTFPLRFNLCSRQYLQSSRSFSPWFLSTSTCCQVMLQGKSVDGLGIRKHYIRPRTAIEIQPKLKRLDLCVKFSAFPERIYVLRIKRSSSSKGTREPGSDLTLTREDWMLVPSP